MARAHPLAAIAVACILIAGCGSSGGARLSAGQLAAQGTAICSRATAAERAITAANAASALPPIVTREIAELHRLSPPAGEQSSYAALLERFSHLNELLSQLAAAARTGSPTSAILSRGREASARAAALAGPLGLASCTSAQ